jgi:hypothetical protein
MEDKALEYQLSEDHEGIKVDFGRFHENGYFFTIKYHEDILFEYNSKNNKSINYLSAIVRNYSFSKRYYYFQGLYSGVNKFIGAIKEREVEINKLTQDDFRVFIRMCGYTKPSPEVQDSRRNNGA